MELLGIAFVVVIVSIGMMYLLVFMVGKPPKLLHATFVQKEVSQNFIGAMLRAQSRSCRGLSISDLLQDCANYDATGGSVVCDPLNDVRSCAYVQQQIEELLSSTVYKWKYNYRFRVYKNTEQRNPLIPENCRSVDECASGQQCVLPGNGEGSCVVSSDDTGNPINYFNPEWKCTDSSDKETPGVQPLPLDVGTLTVMLEICRG